MKLTPGDPNFVISLQTNPTNRGIKLDQTHVIKDATFTGVCKQILKV